jgi:alkylhydroperoxidase/carboxymuconolactone decarboxylase family protein YurZ
MAGGLGEPSQAANDFTMIFHHITAEWCWGYGSVHPGLARKTRSMLNLAVLTALHCRLGTQAACTRRDPAGMPASLAA